MGGGCSAVLFCRGAAPYPLPLTLVWRAPQHLLWGADYSSFPYVLLCIHTWAHTCTKYESQASLDERPVSVFCLPCHRSMHRGGS